MPDVVESVIAILSNAQMRAEIAGQNAANATVPAYKRRVAFTEVLNARDGAGPSPGTVNSAIDFTAGKVVQTGNPFDLAVSGAGFFAVQQGDGLRYVRAGRFTRNPEGRLVDVFGGTLQKAGGGDLVVAANGFRVGSAGEVTMDGSSFGRIAVFAPADAAPPLSIRGGFAEPAGGMRQVEDAEIVQGAYEASNVSTGDEMVAMMQALRQAEAGQRVMIAYDDIMGRVISTFGDSVR